jgi:hypothetical protein
MDISDTIDDPIDTNSILNETTPLKGDMYDE